MLAEAHLYLGVALAGLVSFLSPCVLPLVPPYLSYLGGTTFEQLSDEKGLERAVWRRVVLASVFFVLGFSTVFIALGASASLIGQVIQTWRAELSFAAGLVIILFGLHFLGVLRIPFLLTEKRYQAEQSSASLAGAYVMGLAFAFGWTPCIGPILAAILAVAGTQDTVAQGAGLLAVYSLGLGLPFIGAALAIEPFVDFLAGFKRHFGKVEKIVGVLLVLTGVAFLTGGVQDMSFWLLQTFPGLANFG